MFWRASGQQAEQVVAFDADRSAVDAARREPRQFEALYRKYVGQVYSFALYELRDHHAAEDVTEHVFLRALAGLSRFEERGNGEGSTFRVWLFQITRHAISNERRRSRRRLEAPLEVAEALPAGDDPATVAAKRDITVRAWDAVQRLPAERRRAIVLRFVEEMTTREIAAVLGRSEGAVRVLMHRALRAVAEELRRDEPRARS